MKVSEIGEFGLIEVLAREFGIEYPPRPGAVVPGLLVALGDDAVVTEPSDAAMIWTTDTMVAGEHFLPERTPWQEVGWKALASNLSDIAAMGGKPHLALVTLLMPADFLVEDAVDLYRGLRACADAYAVTLGGGDIVRSPVFAITVALSGTAYTPHPGQPDVLRRDTARPGDLVAVTGRPGESAGGLKLLLASSRGGVNEDRLLLAHQHPVPRVTQGQAAVRGGMRCGMDVSDGLVQDLGHIARASHVEIVIEASKVPLSDALQAVWPDEALQLALAGGEDYELIVIGPEEAMEPFTAIADNMATVIGRVVEAGSPSVRVLDEAGYEINLPRLGWDHFSKS